MALSYVLGEAPSAAQLSSRRAMVAAWLVGLLFLAGLISLVLHHGEIEEFARLLRDMRPEWLLAAGTLQVLSFVCAAMVW